MFYDRFLAISFAITCILLIGCSEDLSPSDSDKRVPIIAGSLGNQAGQVASDFSVLDTDGNLLSLSDELISYDAVLLYFTMWCPVCDSHMSAIREAIKTNYPGIHFINVDYVSGSIEQARINQISNGYRSETVVADPSHQLTNQFKGDMGVTVVINANNEILLNEGFRFNKVIDALDLASQP